MLLEKELPLPNFKCIQFDVASTSEARTHDLPDAKQERYGKISMCKTLKDIKATKHYQWMMCSNVYLPQGNSVQ
jgi:hypothetical protein